jgi:hypothetical protein
MCNHIARAVDWSPNGCCVLSSPPPPPLHAHVTVTVVSFFPRIAAHLFHSHYRNIMLA